MQRVYGNQPPDELSFYFEIGKRFARVAANVEQDERDTNDGESAGVYYAWDEYSFPAENMTDEEIIKNAARLDARYNYGQEREKMASDEWRKDVDSMMLDLLEMAVM